MFANFLIYSTVQHRVGVGIYVPLPSRERHSNIRESSLPLVLTQILINVCESFAAQAKLEIRNFKKVIHIPVGAQKNHKYSRIS